MDEIAVTIVDFSRGIRLVLTKTVDKIGRWRDCGVATSEAKYFL